MPSLPRRLVAVALFAALAGPGASCVTPSVPIPPPEADKMTFDLDADTGSATFAYLPSADFGGALVFVFNRDQGRGVITTAEDDGSVAPTAPFPAAEGDAIVVTFEVDDQLGSICVRAADRRLMPSDEC